MNAPFRVYSNVAQSISDHSLLLATGSAYQQAMADRRSPDAFANDLTGVYATDPSYGANLITIMRQYNLYRFDAGTPAAQGTSAASGSGPSASGPSASGPSGLAQQAIWTERDRPRRVRPRRVRAGPGGIRRGQHSRTRCVCGRGGHGLFRRSGHDRRSPAAGRRAGAAGRSAQPADQHPAVRGADAQDRHDRLHRHGQDAAAAGQAPVPGRRGRQRHPLGATGRLRLDAVPRAAAGLAGTRGKAGHQEPRRHGLPDQVRGTGAGRGRPDRAGRAGVRNQPAAAADPLGPGPGQRVRGVPLGRPAQDPTASRRWSSRTRWRA